MLASRFEELGIKEAAEVEALLGPLSEAIFVEDARAAAQSLSQLKNKPSSVWLVGGDAMLPLDPDGRPTGEILGDDVLVSGSVGCACLAYRIDRRSDDEPANVALQSRLSRSMISGGIPNGSTRVSVTSRTPLDSTDHLLLEVETIEHGDPTGDLKNLLAAIMSAEAQEQGFADAARASKESCR